MLYVWIVGGKVGIKLFWKNVVVFFIIVIVMCFFVVFILVNLDVIKKMGVLLDIVEIVILLGVNMYKDGFVIGGILKIVFLFSLFGKDMMFVMSILSILGVVFLVGVVMGVIFGGGMIGEMLIIIIYGFLSEVLFIIVVIFIIIDVFVMFLNSMGNIVIVMFVIRFIEGKDWINKIIIIDKVV